MIVVDSCCDDVGIELFFSFFYGFVVDDLSCVVAREFRVFDFQCVSCFFVAATGDEFRGKVVGV